MNAQEALWLIPTGSGPWWWVVCAALAAPAAVITFLTMVMGQPFNALLLARVLLLGSFVMFALAPLNSGWVPWGVLLCSAGGLLTSVLIATDWCNRTDPALTMGRALWAWVKRAVAYMAAAVLGRRALPFRPEEWPR